MMGSVSFEDGGGRGERIEDGEGGRGYGRTKSINETTISR